MKIRLLLSMSMCVMMMMQLNVTAQPTIAVGKENKKVEAEILAEGIYAGEFRGYRCIVGENRHSKVQVGIVGEETEGSRTAQVEVGKGAEVLAATVDGEQLGMLVWERDRRMGRLRTVVVDLNTMGAPKMETIDSVALGRRDECYIWAARSEDRRYTGYVMIAQYNDQKQYTARAAVIGAETERIWSREGEMVMTDEIFVTNEGYIVTLGYENREEETEFAINVLGAERAERESFAVNCEAIREMKIAGMVGHTLMAAGTYRQEKTKAKEDICGGIVALSYNIDSAAMTGFCIRPFQNEERNIFLNEKTKNIQKAIGLKYISLCAATTTERGMVAAFGRNYSATGEDGGKAMHYRIGLHVLSIDTEGHVMWVRNVRRNDVAKGESKLLYVGLESDGDNVWLVKNESMKYPDIYDIAREAKPLTMGEKSNLVVYRMGSDGEVKKTVVENKSKYSLIRTYKEDNDHLLLFGANGSRTRMAELKLR